MSGLDLLIVLARTSEAVGGAGVFGAPMLLRLAGTPPDAAHAVRPVTLAAAVALVLGSLLALATQTIGMAGSLREGLAPAALGGVVAETGFGRSVAVRVLAGALALLVALVAPRRPLAVAALGAVALASLAWSGHGGADAGARGALHATGDVVHLLAGGAWLGALAALLALALAARSRASTVEPLAHALRRVSGVGSAMVGLILLSGLLNAWMLTAPERWPELPGDPWGRLLLLKAGLFGLMLVLAALNRWRLTPQLGVAGDGETIALLTRSVGLEALLGAGAMLAAATMGGLAPPAAHG